MRVALYAHTDNPNLSQIQALMQSLSIDFELNANVISSFDLAISLGGDGTFLSAVRKMSATNNGRCLPIFGINSGRLGFLSSAQLSNAAEALRALIDGKYRVENRVMIDVGGISECHKATALNEFTIQKLGTSMVFVELKIDNIEVASYWADGIIISTPTGSTAYSMSVGGAILTPLSSCFIISPIAPHNLSLRPLVVPDSATISLKATTRHNEKSMLATIDNSQYDICGDDEFKITRSDDNLQVITLLDNNFYATLREKLHWGIDIR